MKTGLTGKQGGGNRELKESGRRRKSGRPVGGLIHFIGSRQQLEEQRPGQWQVRRSEETRCCPEITKTTHLGYDLLLFYDLPMLFLNSESGQVKDVNQLGIEN